MNLSCLCKGPNLAEHVVRKNPLPQHAFNVQEKVKELAGFFRIRRSDAQLRHGGGKISQGGNIGNLGRARSINAGTRLKRYLRFTATGDYHFETTWRHPPHPNLADRIGRPTTLPSTPMNR